MPVKDLHARVHPDRGNAERTARGAPRPRRPPATVTQRAWSGAARRLRPQQRKRMNGHGFRRHGSDATASSERALAFIEAKGAKAWIAPRNVRPARLFRAAAGGDRKSALPRPRHRQANKSPYVRPSRVAFSLFKPIFPVAESDISRLPASRFSSNPSLDRRLRRRQGVHLARLARECRPRRASPLDPTEVVEQAEARSIAARSAIGDDRDARATAARHAIAPAPPPPPPPSAGLTGRLPHPHPGPTASRPALRLPRAGLHAGISRLQPHRLEPRRLLPR